MSSDLEKCARKTIEKIMAELSPNRIKQRFDNPIARAAMEFHYEPKCPLTHTEFHRVVADFVEHIYDRALRASWMLPDPLAESIWLLENGYRSVRYGTGYIAALLDANDPTIGGIQTVLTGLSESIKEIEHQKYTKAIFTRLLHGCNWYQLCEIVRILLKDYEAIIPKRLAKCYPAQLVDEIPSLISMFISGDSILQQISLSGEEFRIPEIPFNRKPQ